MTDAIRPALTPEEWEQEPATFVGTSPKLGIRAGVVLRPRDDADNVHPRESHVVSIRLYPDRQVEVLDEEDRLRMAALCLHCHPQGFTRADVKLLDSAVGAVEFAHSNYCSVQICPPGCLAEMERLRSLAARIEALLPPEGA